MAKEFSTAFYHSKAWHAVRLLALHRDMYTCRDCGGRATEVHHRVELTPDNINDANVALNVDNLECLCWLCHDKRTKHAGDVADGYVFDESGQVVKT